MHRTLRITSVIVALAAVVLLVLPVVYGVRKDPAIEALLNGPGAIEKFTAEKGQDLAKDEMVNPLVRRASEFALYLNPPPPPVVEKPPEIAPQPEEPQPMSPVTAKFDLIGTCFYADRPKSSLCLIDEPGKGLSWVKQGSSVGHLVIEEVKDGVIIVNDGKKKSEMSVPVQEVWKTLLKNPPGGRPDISPIDKPVSSVITPAVSRPAPGTRAGRSPSSASPEDPRSRIRSARDARRAKVGPAAPTANPTPTTGNPAILPAPSERIIPPGGVEESAQRASAQTEEASIPPPPLPTEKDIIHIRLMEEVRANRLTAEEAKQIEETAQTLEQLDEIQSRLEQKKR